MRKSYVILSVILISLSSSQAFAGSGTYKLNVNDKTFDIEYIFDGDLIAMDVDKESISLLVGMTNVTDSEFAIIFPPEILSAENDEFVVLVDGLETDYTVVHNEGVTTITFPLIADSEEIEIIGTSIIPEFPLGALAILGSVSIMMIALTQRRRLFKW